MSNKHVRFIFKKLDFRKTKMVKSSIRKTKIKGLFQMKKGTENIEKLCSFYASEWHLTTMLLPYINRELEKNTKIITILEKDIEENIKTLV